MKTNTRVYVGNLGIYNDGYLVGGWLDLPVSENELDKFLKDIVKIDEYYEEYFISDFESDFSIESDMYENLYELNKFIEKIENLNEFDYDFLCAYLSSGLCDDSFSLCDVLELMEKQTDCFLYSSIHGYDDYGRYAFDFDTPSWLENYIDFEQLGEDLLEYTRHDFTPYGLLILE